MRYYDVYISGGDFPSREVFVQLHELGLTCAFCYADYGAGTEIAVRSDLNPPVEEVVDAFRSVGVNHFSVRPAEPSWKTVHEERFETALDREPLHLLEPA